MNPEPFKAQVLSSPHASLHAHGAIKRELATYGVMAMHSLILKPPPC
jgi:hypothetical protein